MCCGLPTDRNSSCPVAFFGKLHRVMRGGCVPISSYAASWVFGGCERTACTCVSMCLCVCLCVYVSVKESPGSSMNPWVYFFMRTCVCVCVTDTVVSRIRAFFPVNAGQGGAWPVCPHVYPSVSGLSLERCGVKDGEPGRCAAIKWWHGWESRVWEPVGNLEDTNIQIENFF